MPRIQEYTAGVTSGIGLDIPGRRMPIEQPRADAGAGLMTVADTLYDVAQRQEVTDVHTKAAKLRADLTLALTDEAMKAPAGDPEFASRFNQRVADALSASGDKIQTTVGRRAWQAVSADLAAHFAEKSGLYQAQSAGVKATQDYLALTDSLRNSLLNDPAQFDDVLKFTTESLNDPNGQYAKMPADAREKLSRQTRADMAASAVQGVIRSNPDLAAQQLRAGYWDQYLDADKKFSLERDADLSIRAREAENLRLEHLAERAAKKAQQAIEDKFVEKVFGADGLQLSTKEIVDSNLTPAQKLHWIGIVESFNRPDKITTNSELVVNLWERIHLPDGDPKKLTDESEVNSYFGKGLTASDVKMLRDEMRGKRSAEGDMESQFKAGAFAAVRTMLTARVPILGLRDPKGDEQYQRFLALALPEWQRQRAAGKSPQALADPDSPDYIGNIAVPLRRSRQQIISDLEEHNSLHITSTMTSETTYSRLDAPAVADVAEPAVPIEGKQYSTPDKVMAELKAGTLSQAAADKIMIDRGWSPKSPPTGNALADWWKDDQKVQRADRAREAQHDAVLNVIKDNSTRWADAKDVRSRIYEVHGIWLHDDGSEVRELRRSGAAADEARAKIEKLFKEHGFKRPERGWLAEGLANEIGNKLLGGARLHPWTDNKGQRVE